MHGRRRTRGKACRRRAWFGSRTAPAKLALRAPLRPRLELAAAAIRHARPQGPDMLRHIAWDPGALPVALKVGGPSRRYTSRGPRLTARHRLQPAARRARSDPRVSETTLIPGNAGLTARGSRRAHRAFWLPFHDAIEALVDERLAADRETWLVSIHSFTPVWKGVDRPWEIGIIHDDDERLSEPLIGALLARGTLHRRRQRALFACRPRLFHAGTARSLARASLRMIEIRNDEIADEAGQQQWGERLATSSSASPPSGIEEPAIRFKGRRMASSSRHRKETTLARGRQQICPHRRFPVHRTWAGSRCTSSS